MSLLDSIKQTIEQIKQKTRHRFDLTRPPAEWVNYFDNPNDVNLSEYWRPGVQTAQNIYGNGDTLEPNRKTKWYGLDNEKNFNKTDYKYYTLKWTADVINYSLNSYGYRGDEPECDGDYNVLVCGDSHSFGVGLDDYQIWTHRLKQMLNEKYKNVSVINLSVPGASNDYIARAIYCALQTMTPDVVIAQYTYPDRRESVWSNGKLWQLNMSIPEGSDEELEEYHAWFKQVNDHASGYNIEKNHKMIQTICNLKKINFFSWHAWHLHRLNRIISEETQQKDLGRDGRHFGPITHKRLASKVYSSIKDFSHFGSKHYVLQKP